ncbi:MAG TPA: hypothetical protein PK083_01575 [Soehngenia sp.]|mgnify:CR=1 FL=1|nr:hypothetical protein [Soehngenia sp.]HPP31131.1 hypothetical protein [Soehngenia sp.]
MNKNDSILVRIMNELLKIYLSYGCEDVTINFKKSDKMGLISLEGSVEKIDDAILRELQISLNTPRRDDTEEYYYKLLGSDYSFELNLLDSMVDEGNVNYEGGKLKIKVMRKLEGGF